MYPQNCPSRLATTHWELCSFVVQNMNPTGWGPRLLCSAMCPEHSVLKDVRVARALNVSSQGSLNRSRPQTTFTSLLCTRVVHLNRFLHNQCFSESSSLQRNAKEMPRK